MLAASFNKTVLLVLPLVLTVSCLSVFRFAVTQYGTKWGYFAGFLFYWIIWCVTVPLVLIRPKAIRDFFRASPVFDYKILLCLFAFLIFVYAYAFPKAVHQATKLVIACSLLLAFVNATLEEVLWRATYLQVFTNPWISIGYAAFGFAVRHYAPQAVVVNRNPGGAHSFVLFSLVISLCYGYVSYRQQSVFWTVLCHTLLDFAGLGALFYFQ